MENVTQVLDAFGRTQEELKKANEQRFAELTGRVDGVSGEVKEKIAKIAADIDGIKQISEATQAKINRLSHTGEKGETPEQTEYKAAFGSYLRRGREDGLRALEAKGMTVQSDPDGGYFVTPDMSGRVVSKVYQVSPIRQFASVTTIGTESLEGYADLDEADGGWVGEVATRSETDFPQIGRYSIHVHELHASPRASQKLLDDANRDVEAWLSEKVSNKFSRLENTAFVSGLGVAKPRGFASYTTAATADATRAWGVPEHVATAANGSFGTDPVGIQKIVALFHAMKGEYLPGAAWYMNQTTLGAMRLITESSSIGRFNFIPSFQAGMPDMMLGLPIRVIHEMATYTTTDSLAVMLANLGVAYQIVDRVGIRVLRDPFTAKPNVIFYTTKRVGADVVNFEAIKFIKFGS